jgi:peptidoglycan hydrolase FlgJ
MIKPLSSQITPSAPVRSPREDLRAAAQKFEAVILRELIGAMRKGKLADDVFGSSATDNFRELADARTAETMAGLGQFGIAALVEQQFAGKDKLP